MSAICDVSQPVTMGIFSRRNIQRMIDENSSFMTHCQLSDAVQRLNSNDFQSLDTEWELAVLNAFSKVGRIQHEVNHGGATNPDIFFTSKDGNSFVADITTVSDEGFEKQNPVEYLQIELQERIRKVLPTAGGFHLRIERLKTSRVDDSTQVAIPNRGDFAKDIFNSDFRSFLGNIKLHPSLPHEFKIDTATTKVCVSYTPGGSDIFSSNMPAYTKARKPTNNPVFNSLKSKHRQLSRSGYKGTRAVILCDAGSDMFQGGFKSPWQPEYHAEDIVRWYLGRNHSIDFVLILRADWLKRKAFDPGPARYVSVTICGNRNYDGLPESIRNAIYDLMSHFPEPHNTATGARKSIRNRFDPKTFRATSGGLRMTGNSISVSSNSILALMAGHITHAEFMESIGNTVGKPAEIPRNVFASKIAAGLRIGKISVEERSGSDDDDITFEFVRDPGISDFRLPNE